MKHVFTLLIAAFPLLAPAQQRKVLIIGIDGCRGDAILAANAPRLQQLAASGFSTFEGNTHPPVWSGTGWSTMLTGVWEQKHNVTDNTFSDPQYATWPHFFARIHSVQPTMDLRSFVHWAPINEEICTSATQELELPSDTALADSAVAALQATDAPDVLFLDFDDVDHAGHTYGFSPDIPGYLDAIATVDHLIAPILDAVAARPADEEWMVMVVTDHGGSTWGHGDNAFEQQRIFILASGPGIAVENRPATRDTFPIATTMDFGPTTYVRVDNNALFNFGTAQDFTIECNVRMPLDWDGDPAFLCNKDWDSGYNPGYVLSTTGGGYTWKFNIGDGTHRVDLDGRPINDGQWHHLAVTCDRDGEARIFQDGLLMGTADMSAIGDISTAMPTCFGQDGTTAYPYAMTGNLCDVRIWSKALDINTISAWSGKPLTPAHPDAAFLIGHWPMQDGTGGLLANTVPGSPAAQVHDGTVPSSATWSTNSDPLITTDLTLTPVQADVVPTVLAYLCIPNDPLWQLDGHALIPACIPTGMGEQPGDGPPTLFPNPTRDQLHLQLRGRHDVQVIAPDGRLVLHHATGDGPVDVGALTPGTYVLRITDAVGAVSFARFVKEL